MEVLNTIAQEYLSLREVCLKFNIPSESVIIKWQRDFSTFGIEVLHPKPKGRPKSMNNFKRKKRKSDTLAKGEQSVAKPLTREEELLQEIESLRCENALLKKLQALIQAEEEANKRKP